MLVIAIGAAVFVLWPEGRPLILGLALLTVIGMVLARRERTQRLGPLAHLMTVPSHLAAHDAAYAAALEREDFDQAERLLGENPDFARYQDAKRGAFVAAALGDEEALAQNRGAPASRETKIDAAHRAQSALRDLLTGADQRAEIPTAEILAHLEALKEVAPSAHELYGSSAVEPASAKPDAYKDGTDLFPYAPPDFADVVDEAIANVQAFHAAYARLSEAQRRNLLLLPFPEQSEPAQQDAIAAWCTAVGGLYDRRTGKWEQVGLTPRTGRLQHFLAVSSSIAYGDAAEFGVVMPAGTKHLDPETARRRLVQRWTTAAQ